MSEAGMFGSRQEKGRFTTIHLGLNEKTSMSMYRQLEGSQSLVKSKSTANFAQETSAARIMFFLDSGQGSIVQVQLFIPSSLDLCFKL